jgi:hypothetical protein
MRSRTRVIRTLEPMLMAAWLMVWDGKTPPHYQWL